MKTPLIVSDFRAGLAGGDLLIQNCHDCDKPNMWPRYACPHCQSGNLGWVKSSGKGILHSFCVLRQGAPEGLEATGENDWSAYGCDDEVEFVAVDSGEIERRPCATFRRVG